MYDIDPADLIDFAKTWSSLGEVVTEQVEKVLDDPRCGNCFVDDSENGYGVNPDAIEMAAERLRGMNQTLDHAFDEFLAAH